MSLAACLSEILGEGPASDDEAYDWLAARGLGLVPVADPSSFEWPGRFLGRWPSGDWVVLFGVPPGVVLDPSGKGVQADAIASAFVVTAHRPVPAPPPPAESAGVVEHVFVAEAAEAPARAVDSAPAGAGRGLEGDRYFDGAGTFSERVGTGREITLADADALRSAEVAPGEARRNVVVRGIDLDGLIGRRFRIGEVECVGRRRCEPCAHLQRLTRPDVLRALVHRGGLRADVVSGGVVRVGDAVVAL